MTPMRRQFAFALNVALLGVLAVAIDVLAQAWLPAKGEGTVAVAVQSTNVKNHLLTRTPVAAGEIDSYSLMADLTYGLTDKIAVDFALPFVMSKYVGNSRTRGPTSTTERFAVRSRMSDSRCGTT